MEPDAVTDAEIEALKARFSGDQIVELVAEICLLGSLNRWNDTMAAGL